jgi:hypothetical protein
VRCYACRLTFPVEQTTPRTVTVGRTEGFGSETRHYAKVDLCFPCARRLDFAERVVGFQVAGAASALVAVVAAGILYLATGSPLVSASLTAPPLTLILYALYSAYRKLEGSPAAKGTPPSEEGRPPAPSRGGVSVGTAALLAVASASLGLGCGVLIGYFASRPSPDTQPRPPALPAAVVAAGKAEPRKPGAPARRAEPRFDPEDLDSTFRWLVKEQQRIEEVSRRQNEMALADATKEFKTALEGLKGKEVRWRFRVSSVSQKAIVVQGLSDRPASSEAESFLQVQAATYGGDSVHTAGFRFHRGAVWADEAGWPNPGLELLGEDEVARAKKYGQGDTIALRGKVHSVSFGQVPNFGNNYRFEIVLDHVGFQD